MGAAGQTAHPAGEAGLLLLLHAIQQSPRPRPHPCTQRLQHCLPGLLRHSLSLLIVCVVLWRDMYEVQHRVSVCPCSHAMCLPPALLPVPLLNTACPLQSPYHVNMGVFCVVMMEQLRAQQQQQDEALRAKPQPCAPAAAAPDVAAHGDSMSVEGAA